MGMRSGEEGEHGDVCEFEGRFLRLCSSHLLTCRGVHNQFFTGRVDDRHGQRCLHELASDVKLELQCVEVCEVWVRHSFGGSCCFSCAVGSSGALLTQAQGKAVGDAGDVSIDRAATALPLFLWA